VLHMALDKFVAVEQHIVADTLVVEEHIVAEA
jgi:hypothetical protein